ncbi:MAG: CoA pyrophosphatase [Polaribacter sp.]|nr:CoA pyrophosphatase [Polaribacter sp.]
MIFSDFKNTITTLQTKELGGQDVQFKLAPAMRLKYDAAKIAASHPRMAAVLVLFYPNKEQETCILLTQRARYQGPHSAQISFPGGKTEATDTSLLETALRETYEEVGVSKTSVIPIRELTSVFIPPSNFLATPFMAYAEQPPIFHLNDEVDQTIDVLLSDLLAEESISSVMMHTSYMDSHAVPCFKLNNYVVWGATAMMLSEIKELFKAPLS